MDCPICGREMEEGRLSAGEYSIKWTTKKWSFSGKAGSPDEIQIQDFALLRRNRARAFLCWKCRKILLDIPEE